MGKKYIVLFDLDGTLIDSTQAIYASFCQAYRLMGRTPPLFDEIKRTIGYTLEDMFITQGIPPKEAPIYVGHYREAYHHLMEEGTHLLPYVKEALHRASAFAYLGVVTTKRGDFSKILLERLGVGGYFDCIVGIESTTYPKPHAEPILKALELLRASQKAIGKKHIYMIGDTMLDIEAAQNAGICSVGVLCGFGLHDVHLEIPLCDNTLQAVDYIAQKHSI